MFVLKDKTTCKFWCGKSSWDEFGSSTKFIENYEDAIIKKYS